MRAIFYSVVNVNTNEKISVGVDCSKAQEKLFEMKKANPANDYRISYKWASI